MFPSAICDKQYLQLQNVSVAAVTASALPSPKTKTECLCWQSLYPSPAELEGNVSVDQYKPGRFRSQLHLALIAAITNTFENWKFKAQTEPSKSCAKVLQTSFPAAFRWSFYNKHFTKNIHQRSSVRRL